MARITNGGLTIYNIGRVIGHCTRYLGRLCTSIKVNPFSKWKPFRFAAGAFPYAYKNEGGTASTTSQEAKLESLFFGFTGPVFTSKAMLFSGTPANGSINYTYERPLANQWRIKDFLNYFHDAPPCFMQANGASFTIDLVQTNPDPFLFYLLMNYKVNNVNGPLSNKAFSTASGINDNASAVSDGDLNYTMTVEDLTFMDSGASNQHKLIDPLGNYQAFLGIVVYDGSGSQEIDYVECFETTYPVAEQTTIYNEMFKISTTSLTSMPIGNYTAVACARIIGSLNNIYLPVFSKPSFPAKFALKCGGLNYYPWISLGIAENQNGPYYTASFTSMYQTSDFYIKVQIYNRGPKAVDLYYSDPTSGQYRQTKIGLKTQISRTGYPSWSCWATPIKPDNNLPDYVSVNPGSTFTAIYKLEKVWSTDGGTSAASMVEPGSTVTLLPKLNFHNDSSLNHNYPYATGNANYPSYTITQG